VWDRHKVDFAGRKGFIRLALEHDVPIVPVVAIGGQETSLFLSRGETLAKTLMLDKLFRLKVLPISLAVPWGLNVGDFLGHLPLPAKIVVEVLPPIDLREEFGDEPDLQAVYDEVTARMQAALDALGRRAPAPDHRMRIVVGIEVAAPCELVWEFVADPTRYLHFMQGMTRYEVVGQQAQGVGARYRTLMRVGSARSWVVEVVEWDESRDLAWNSVTGVDQRGRWRLRERPDDRTHVEFRFQYGVAARGSWVARRAGRRADRALTSAPLGPPAQAPDRARATPPPRGRAARAHRSGLARRRELRRNSAASRPSGASAPQPER